MISPNTIPEVSDGEDQESPEEVPKCVLLVRYGVVPQVARFGVREELHNVAAAEFVHGARVVVNSDRGLETGMVLEVVRLSTTADDNPVTGNVVRLSTTADLAAHQENRSRCDAEFFDWQTRLSDWQLQLQLVDIEWTLDREQVVLYVLNGQDAETTRLALLAAAAGLGIIHVQPVAAEGILQKVESGGGGCGSGGGGCGSGGCGN